MSDTRIRLLGGRVAMRLCAIGLVALTVSCSPALEASRAASGTPTTNVAANATLAAPTTAQTATTSAPATSAASPNRRITVTAIGYGSGSFGVGYGFTVRNENPAEAAESVSVQVAWQDAAGTVLGTESQSIPVLGPAEHTGVGGTSFSSAIKSGAKMTVQVLPTKWTATKAIPTFTFTNATYVAETFSTKVTGVVKSPYTKDLKLVRVSAIGVDGSGQIVGGGFTFVDFVPAGGTAAVSVSYSGQKPANVAMYAQLTSLSLLLGQ